MNKSLAHSRRALLMGEVIERSRREVFAREVQALAERNQALAELANRLARELRESLNTLANCTRSLSVQCASRLEQDTRVRLAGIAEYARRTSRLVEELQPAPDDQDGSTQFSSNTRCSLGLIPQARMAASRSRSSNGLVR